MNKVFKVIWNHATQSFVAVSELTKAHKKVKSSQDKRLSISTILKTSLLASVTLIGAGNAMAAIPEGTAATDGVAIGTSSKASATGGIALGKNSTTAANYGIAIGINSSVEGNGQSIAIGGGRESFEGAKALGDQSIAIGGNTKAKGHSSIAIGGDDVDLASQQTTKYTNLAGTEVSDTVDKAFTALTNKNLLQPRYLGTSSGQAAIALGMKATAGDIALAMGTLATASKTNSIAIGTGATANRDNAVAIGGGATTENAGTKQTEKSYTVNGTTYKFTWAGGENTSPGDIVSFGSQGYERQLKNVAPGEVSATSTDAVNGSQLNAVAEKVAGGWFVTAGKIAGGTSSGESKQSVKPEDSVTLKAGKNMDIAQSSRDFTFSVSPTLNDISSISGQDTNLNFTANGLGLNNKKITGVADGSAATDAVNVQQLNAVKNSPITFTSNTGTSAVKKLGESLKIKGDGNDISGVSTADDITFSLNKSTTVTQGDNKVVTGDAVYNAIQANQVHYFSVSSVKPGNKDNRGATGNDAIAIGPESTAGDYAVALGNKAIASNAGSIAVGSENKAEARDGITIGRFASTNGAGNSQSIAIGGGNYDGAGAKATGDQSIAIGGNTNARGNSSIVIGGDDITRSSSVQTTYTDPTSGNEVNGTIEKAYNAITGRPFKMINGTTEFRTAETGESAVALGSRAIAGDVALALGTNAEAAKTNSIAIGTGAVANIDNAVAIGGGSTTDKQGTKQTSMTQNGFTLNWAAGDKTLKGDIVSFGSEGYERQLKNVAAGEVSQTSTDAINGSQLYAVAEIATAGWNITSEADGGTANNPATENVKPKDLVKLKAGKNMVIDQSTKDFKFSVSPTLTDITSVSGAGTTMAFGADGITLNDKKISGVANGVADKDAVNVSQLNALGNNTIKLGGNTGTTNAQTLNKQDGLQFNVKGANGLTTKASGAEVTVEIDADTKAKIDNAADNNLSNITPNGKKVITDLVDMENGDNTVVSNTTDATTGKKTFKVNVTTTALSVDGTSGTVTAPVATDASKPVTADSVATAINNVAWKAAGSGNGATGDVADTIKAGKTVTFDAGENLVLTHTANKFSFATAKQVNFDKVTVGTTNISKDNGIDAGNHKITNVTAGVNDTDAVNKSQLNELANKAITFTSNSGTSAVKKLGETLQIKGDGTDISGVSTADDITFSLNKATSVTANDEKAVTSKAVHTAIQNINLNTAGNSGTGSVNLATSTLSITGENGITTTAANNGIKVGLDTDTKAKIDNAANQDLSNITPNGKGVITDLVDIENGNNTVASSRKDANGKKILKVDVTTTDVTVEANGQAAATSTAPATAQSVANAINNAFWNVTSNNEQTSPVKAGDTVKFLDGQNINITKNDKTFTINTAKEVTFDKVTVGNAVIDKNNGINAGNQNITNVKDGVNDTDAVNLKQLKEKETALTNAGLDFTGNNDTVTVHRNLGQKLIVKGAHDATDVSAKNIYVEADATGSLTVKMAENPEFKGVKLVDGNNAVNLTPTADGLKVSKADGSDAKIGGVAEGTEDNDAVNVKQLNNLKDSPLTFAGDAGTNVKRKLGETINIKGGETDDNKLVDGNIGVITDGTDTLKVKLAKELKNLTSAQFVDGNNNTVINGNGITITPANGGTPVSLTNTGLDNGGNKITNVADGVDSKDAVNKGQLDKATQDLTTLGFGLKAQDGKESKKALGNTIEVVGDDQNISTEIDETDATNKKLKVKLSKDLNINTVTAGTTKLDSNGLKVGDITVTNAPITVGGTTVNNVNDAINKTAEQAFKDLTVTGNTNNDTGNNGTQQKLGSTLAIEGGLTDAAKASTAKNVRTVVTDNKVEIQIAEKPEFKEVQLVDGNNAVNLTPTADGL
ncbi:ESPR-type extended signal peptide-containing protein, partial [Aggregatibacter kilianii]